MNEFLGTLYPFNVLGKQSAESAFPLGDLIYKSGTFDGTKYPSLGSSNGNLNAIEGACLTPNGTDNKIELTDADVANIDNVKAYVLDGTWQVKTADTDLYSISGTTLTLFYDSSWYASQIIYFKAYDSSDVLLFDFEFTMAKGDKAYDLINKVPLRVQGTGSDTTFWDTNTQDVAFKNIVNGFDRWQNVSDSEYLYLPLTDDGEHLVPPTEFITNREENTEYPFTPTEVKDGDVTLFDAKGLLFYQGIEHGDFDATTGWTPINGNGAVSSNVYSLTGNGGNAFAQVNSDSLIPCVEDDVITIRVRARAINAVCEHITIYLDGSTGGTAKVIVVQEDPIENQWYEFIETQTVGADFTGTVQLKIRQTYADAGTANGKVMEVDGNGAGVQVINLTTAFGAGNEPTADEVASWTPDYFEGFASVGTQTITSQNLAETETNTLDLPIIGASLPNGVADRIYQKADLGFWHEQNIVDEYTLQSGDMDNYDNTTYTNVDIVRIPKKADYKYVATAIGIIGSSIFEGYPEMAFVDSTDNENTFATNISSANWYIVVSAGLYADIAAARAALAGIKIYYELATAVTTELSALTDQLETYEDGTIFVTPDTIASKAITFDYQAGLYTYISEHLQDGKRLLPFEGRFQFSESGTDIKDADNDHSYLYSENDSAYAKLDYAEFFGKEGFNNLFVNPRYSDGSYGWNAFRGDISSSNNIAKVIGDGSATYMRVRQVSFSTIDTHKYYIECKSKISDDVCATLEAVLYDGSSELVVEAQSSPTNATWYVLSGAVTATGTTASGYIWVVAKYASTVIQNGKTVEIDGVYGAYAYDLTALVASGDLPSDFFTTYDSDAKLKTYCDSTAGKKAISGYNIFNRDDTDKDRVMVYSEGQYKNKLEKILDYTGQ